ncbi:MULTISPECIES: type II/IV secretion system ATPase subunit [Halobacterium]|uniref:type II/IV secretion system ATPase subunit n=1 Tax=Halobacterium TaxID=2239 RepID=UPI00196414AA|nr:MULTISPECIES: type II/IV secretion system ATPase subunit [Halobacterium]MCF2206929.1 type II/IV secretion system ATPase subunit [Halobacterium salinarum]MCF2241711.1 type II/IV secretion system ATPase subunit [Halobacterium salinarum]MDL0121612.1 type II/IV secretion system ATPase subunit [Halobacterium salinarum]MDL0126697.1 type II/IV secretion system ATPase subunit [Halobacterium salinarum]MDL0130713.1 type II/IV secretion system ATPase subunit [Halobacterium salinarum]
MAGDLFAGLDGGLDALQRRASRIVEVLRGTAVDVPPYDPQAHGPLVEFDGVADYEEVDRYWVNAPYAFVFIGFDAESDTHYYHVVEPHLDDFEQTVLDQLYDDIRDALIYDATTDPDDREAVLIAQMQRLLSEYSIDVTPNAFHRLFYYLHRTFEGFEKLDPVMQDPHIEDVSCDGYGLPLFVYHTDYTDIETNITYEQQELDSFVVRLAQQSGRHISIGDPVTETTLPDGSRAELALGEEVTPRGSAFTIRKYSEEPFTPATLVDYDTFSLDQMAYLWLAIESNKSLLFAGGTASGKTTSMNAVSMFVPPRAKILTIEDTRELALYHDNWLSSVTRGADGGGGDTITMYDLLRSALRHRPEYIIVGEVRGEEAMTLFQAMNTGHTTYSTMHADSVQTVINRLENDPINVPRAMIQSLDILCVQTLTHVGDERVRRSSVIAEIEGIDQRTGDLDYSTAFEWDPTRDDFEQRDSNVLDEIQDERGWSRSDLLRELRNRKRVLQYLVEQDVTDYRRFTALINEYYAQPERVVARVTDALDSDVAAAAPGVVE